MYKYIPLNYFTYNRPYYFGASMIFLIFGIFYIILYLAFKYEYYNRLNHCDPMFYYGKPCQNEYSNELLFNPEFLEFKKKYYEIVAKYDEKKNEYEGVRENTMKNKQSVEESEEAINENIESNYEFGKDSLNEMKKMVTIVNLITTKYLGNLEEVLSNIQNAPKYVLENLQKLSFDLAQLRGQIEEASKDPYFKKFTSPLSKLYKSLLVLDQTTQPYLNETTREKS